MTSTAAFSEVGCVQTPFGELKMPYTTRKDNVGGMGLPTDDEADIICENQNRKGSVLVADGDNNIRNEFSAITDKMRYDVVLAGNGEEALDLLLKRSFDIVFTVLKMPGMGGLNLSLQIKAISLNTPVVLILDEHLENIMNRIKAGRIDCVISKPLSFGEIQKTVQYFVTNRSRVQRFRGSGFTSNLTR